MRAQPTASHFVAGSYTEGSGPRFDSIYAATGEVIAQLTMADDALIARAIAAAAKAQAEWAITPLAQRGRILRRAAEIMRARNHELSVLETLDTGKPLQETLVADAASGADSIEYFGGIIAGQTSEMIDLGGNFVYTRREPLGICVGIGAWNYPIQGASWKAAPALAAGNAMIFKPSEVTPLSALKLAEILHEAGVPAGLFQVLQGDGRVGAALINHPQVAKVSLTGSVATGAKVAAQAGATLKKVTLELGGKSPLIIFEDADIENAVSGAMLGNFYSSGQVCSNGTRVFVHRRVRARFLERLVARTRAIRLGDPLDPDTQMGPLVNRSQYDKVLGYIALGKAEGAQCVTGGAPARVPGLDKGLFVEPTVFVAVTDDMTIAREEIFGPVMCVLDFEDEEEVIARANALDVGLSAGVFTRDLARAHRVVGRLQAGSCWINTYNLTPVEAPFGGYKQSGIGRENSRLALDYYSQVKSVYVELGDVAAPY